MLPVALMDARNSQFLQRTATNSSGSLQLKSPVSIEAGDFGLYTLALLGLALLVRMGLLGGCLPWWVFARRELTSALLVLMGVLRLPWRRLVWRVSCICLGTCLLAELWGASL